MIIAICLTIAVLFFLLSAMHIYWLFGGLVGLEASLPTDADGRRVLNPKKFDTLIVALGLAFFGLFYLVVLEVIRISSYPILLDILGWIIPAIFILRSIGEFRYVGLFKKVRTTNFASWDDKLYIPLCAFIGISGLLIKLF